MQNGKIEQCSECRDGLCRVAHFALSSYCGCSVFRVAVLPVALRVPSVLDGERRAAVQASEARGALRFLPSREAVAHRYRSGGAAAGAASAVSAFFGQNPEVACAACTCVGEVVQARERERQSCPTALRPVPISRHETRYGVYPRLRLAAFAQRFLLVA